MFRTNVLLIDVAFMQAPSIKWTFQNFDWKVTIRLFKTKFPLSGPFFQTLSSLQQQILTIQTEY